MNKYAVFCCMLLVSVSIAFGGEPAADVRLNAPEGWRKERIVLPPPFAPDMKLKGLEEIRFAPGMFQLQSDSFFSYVFVFQLENKPELSQEIMERELLAYYRGLATAVLKSRNASVDTNTFTLKLTKASAIDDAPKPPQIPRQFTGDLKWVEPFVTGQSQTLHLELQSWKSQDSNHRFMFVCASPKPKTTAIWRQMREIRNSFHRLNGTLDGQ
jgi:hypothetical protein